MSARSGPDEPCAKGQVLLEGCFTKFKTMKKKYFVARGESAEASARLEYYGNLKKYKSGQKPKTISLKICFNINRKTDTKHKHVLALYFTDQIFAIILDTEQQLEEWLRTLLQLQAGAGGEDVVDGAKLKPAFEHMWKVKLQDKGLGDSKNLVGPYYVCLSDQTLSLIKVASLDHKQDRLEFPLTHIRSCGPTESFFYIEVGRQSVTGDGELWMLTEDPLIAKNMNTVISSAFTLRQNMDPHRTRSFSVTEGSRPKAPPARRQTHGGQGKPFPVSPYSGSWNSAMPAMCCPGISISVPQPSDNYYDNVAPISSGLTRAPLLAAPRSASHRRHSVSAVSSCSAAMAPMRAASLDVPDPAHAHAPATAPPSTVISHQRTKSCPVTDSSCLPLIVEPTRVLSQSHVTAHHSAEDRRGSGGAFRRPLSVKSSTGTRERCDSMPSSNRAGSDSTHRTAMPRPTSVHLQGLSYSPPGPAGPYSTTDSAGSSLSIDEAELDRTGHAATPDDHTIFEENADDALQWPHDSDIEAEKLDTYMVMGRPPASLSLPIHASRKVKLDHGSSCGSSPSNSDYMPMSPADARQRMRSGTSPSSHPDSLPMSPADGTRRVRTGSSPSYSTDYLPMSPSSGSRRIVSSKGTQDCLPMSPSESHRRTTVANSPSNHSDYLPMSPADSHRRTTAASSPSNHSDYLPMSPSDGVHRGVHSRESSTADDSYVPMAPVHSDDGYVDMDPVGAHRFMHDDHHSDMSPGSSCSVTSGTPLSDHYLLEKVSAAYFTPSEEEEGSTGRPARTYSFGSQPKSRLEVLNAAEQARVRAYSMGTQQRPNAHKLTRRPLPSGKFSSAPLLSSSWSGASRPPPTDPNSDLMELDFTKNSRGAARFRGLPENLAAHVNSSADSGYMDMSSKSPPRASPPKPASTKHLFSPPDSKSLRKPAIIASTALKTIGEKPDIKPQKFPTTSSANINILPNKHHAPDKAYVEMKPRVHSSSESRVNEGYMDMTPGAKAAKAIRKCSMDSAAVRDYTPMTCGKRASDSHDYVPMTAGKRSSQPIAILGNSSPSSRKSASTTPPKPPNYLALDTTGSLNQAMRRNPKRKSRKKGERSKENVTTPTAMFPLSLNSPQSPKKVYPAAASAAAPVQDVAGDATSLATPLDRVLRICSKDNPPAQLDEPDEGDYALMRPGVMTTQRWTPPNRLSDDANRLSMSRPPSSPRQSDGDGSSRLSFDKAGPSGGGGDGPCEPCRLHAVATAAAESHAGVTRQVSTSSSSSTEVMSVKEGVCGTERDITYASLALGSEGEEPRSPRPSPAPSPAPAGPFSYAEIDFQKSESLRAQAQSFNAKIRH